jgi:hypothetical protein
MKNIQHTKQFFARYELGNWQQIHNFSIAQWSKKEFSKTFEVLEKCITGINFQNFPRLSNTRTNPV